MLGVHCYAYLSDAFVRIITGADTDSINAPPPYNRGAAQASFGQIGIAIKALARKIHQSSGPEATLVF